MWCASPHMFLQNHVQKKWLHHLVRAYISTLKSPRIAADLSTRACWLQGHVWCQKVMKQLNGLGLDHTILLQIHKTHMVPRGRSRVVSWLFQNVAFLRPLITYTLVHQMREVSKGKLLNTNLAPLPTSSPKKANLQSAWTSLPSHLFKGRLRNTCCPSGRFAIGTLSMFMCGRHIQTQRSFYHAQSCAI